MKNSFPHNRVFILCNPFNSLVKRLTYCLNSKVKIMNKILGLIIITVLGTVNAFSQVINTGILKVLPETKFSCLSDFKNTATADLNNNGAFFVYAGYHNEGIIRYEPTFQGMTHFKGEHVQTVSGTVPCKLKNVTFDNHSTQPAFLLSGEISIAGISNFDYGIVKVENRGGFIFEEDAIHFHTSNDSHIEGFVERYGNLEFQFPIGHNGLYNSMTIGTSQWSEPIFRGRFWKENSNALYPHNQKEEGIELIDELNYWELEYNHHDDHELPLTLPLENVSGTILNSDSDAAIAIVYWDNAEMKWKSYETVVDNGNQIATAMIKRGGVFALAKITKTEENNEESGEVIVYNGLSGNGDGKNDYFFIDGLSKFPENTLEVFNRWGVKVYEADSYGRNDNWFRGYSEVKGTVNKGKKLPSGTYFYTLIYKKANEVNRRAGYLYIN